MLSGRENDYHVCSSYSCVGFLSFDKTARGIIRRIIMYRPEGWNELNPCEYVSIKAPFTEVFEAGADALLEGLMRQDDWVRGYYYGSGKWVFIPDDGD